MKRKKPLTRSPMSRARKPMKKGGRIKPNATKTRKRLARTHGPKAFREFTAAQPCAACGIVGYSQAAHLLGNGGR